MRIKMLFMALLAIFACDIALTGAFLSDAAMAQGQRRGREPENTVPPLMIGPRATPPQNVAPPPLTPENTWVLDLSNGGRVRIQLRSDLAPRHVERIKALTARGFYNGLSFHRVIEGFMAQGGDPQGTGSGASDLPDLAQEFNDLPHLRGTVSMARAQSNDSANSQFYIMFVPRLGMDHDYTVFGRVVGGMNFVDQIARGEPPAVPTRIVRASIGSDNAAPPTPEETAALMARFAPSATPVPGSLTAVPTGAPVQGSGSPPRAPAGQAPPPTPAPAPAPGAPPR